MTRIAEKAKFIGRFNEITELATLLESVVMGKGQIVFISGEAGIGKTRFINHVRSLPIGQRFNWLTAQCIYQEGTDAYLPFVDALKDWVTPEQTGLESAAKPSAKKTEDIFNLDDLAKIPMIGPKLVEDQSMSFGSFMIKEPKAEFCIKVLKSVINSGRKGLCITRLPPEQIGEWIKNENLKYYWLCSKPGPGCLTPSLTKISHEISEYLRLNPNSIVLLDGIEYILGHLEFNQVLRFVNELVDSMAINKSILFIPINPLTIDPKQLALFERNMNSIDIGDLDKPQAEARDGTITLENTHKFISEELQNGRDRMFEKTTQTIINLASIKPVVFFIDDLHWADDGALHLLHYLARAIKNHNVAIIGTFRSEDLANVTETHPLQALLDRLIPEKLITIINLERLDITETGDMIRSLLGSSDLPEKLDEFLFTETEGNPFFIEEVLRSLEEDGAIAFNENQNSWILTKKIPEIKIPETIRDVVHSRLNRLPKDMRLVLEIASVLGEEFEYDILSKVAKFEEEELVTNLDDLMRYKILLEQPTTYGQPIRYRFAHNKIGEVLYNGLGESHKRLLHAKAAVAIEEKYQNNMTPVIYELAHHSYHGGDYDRSLKYTMKAGEKALLDFAPEKAKTFNQWALNSIELVNAHASKESVNVQLHLDVLTKLTEICSLIGELDDAMKYTNTLLEISEEHKVNEKTSDAHIYLSRIFSLRSIWPDAIEHIEKALNSAKEVDYQRGMLDAYYELGRIHEKLGEYKKAEDYFHQFMDVVSSSGSDIEISRGYDGFARITHNRGEYKTAIEYYQKCLDLLLTTNNYKELAKTYTNMGVSYFELDEYDKVIECHEKCIEFATRAGDIRALGYGYSNAAEVYANQNKLELATNYSNKALEIFTKLDEKHMIGLVLMNYGIIYKNRQDWDSSSYYFEKSLALLEMINVPSFLADCNRQYALMFSKQNTSEANEKSKKYLQKSLEIYKELGVKKYIDMIQNELDKITK